MLTSKRNNPYTPLLLFILTLLILLLTTLLLLPLTLSPDLLASLSPYSPYPYPYPYPYPHPYSQGPQEFSTQSPPSCSCTTNPPPASSSPYTRTFYEYPPLESTTLDSTSQPPWETILLPIHGGGGIRTPNSDTGVNDTVLPILYGLGMFHQLHCLIVLRGIIFPETSQRKVNSTAMSFRGDMEGDMEHWAHCFDYLAQVGTVPRPAEVSALRGWMG